MKLILGIDPVPASRPRVTRQGWTYYAEPYKSFKKDLVEEVRQSLPPRHRPIAGPMAVSINVFVTRPETTKLPMPKPDVDNFAKAVLDACNKLVWTDDWLVQVLTVEKAWVDSPGWIEMNIVELPH